MKPSENESVCSMCEQREPTHFYSSADGTRWMCGPCVFYTLTYDRNNDLESFSVPPVWTGHDE